MYTEEERTSCEMTVTQYNHTFSWKSPYSDCDMEDFLEAFYGIMVGLTFQPDTVLTAMRDFAEERLPKEEVEDETD